MAANIAAEIAVDIIITSVSPKRMNIIEINPINMLTAIYTITAY